LGGAGVARGYLGRPDLTAERFIPDPLSGEAGGRLYRTGDVARRLAGGELDFLGRGDGQVKVRGFRVELGEVEAALLRHESVREATVVARGQAGADVRLAAYVTLEPDAEGGRERPGDEVEAAPESNLSRLLKRYLSERLPDYMIPSWVCVLEALPLTPNGKIDRRALPEPTSAAEAGAAEYVAPRDETETRIAAVWAEVLGVERVGVNDNFFDLGGHSLLATQVVARLRREFNITLPLRSLFESPDVAGLALAVAQAAGAQAEKELPEVAAAGRGGKSLEQLLAELQRLSADEVNRMLEEKKQRQGGDA
ncbi:MAG: AMP-binding protein, partial [Acidobacteria bacterium]|nr:AMP-binding protein [Acidobacteriota bacterium]